MSVDLTLLLAEMQADFLDELPERCNRLEERVLALESGAEGAFDELYREVHSLKGAGGIFHVPIITTICHQFESYISEAGRKTDSAALGVCLRYVDLLRRTATPGGRDTAGVAAIEQELEQLRVRNLYGRSSVLLAEPSEATGKLYRELLTSKNIRVDVLTRGLEVLQCLLHEPFDLLVISRELPDLNALGVVAALRESRSRNSDIPVVLVSSSRAPVPDYLRIRATLARDTKLATNLMREIEQVVARKAS